MALFVYIFVYVAAMFGRVRLKTVFRTTVKRDCSVRLTDITSQASNIVVISGRFIYFLEDNTAQVALFCFSHLMAGAIRAAIRDCVSYPESVCTASVRAHKIRA